VLKISVKCTGTVAEGAMRLSDANYSLVYGAIAALFPADIVF
jgi:hypothetical protein